LCSWFGAQALGQEMGIGGRDERIGTGEHFFCFVENSLVPGRITTRD
jgi:hypothetical protein